MNSHRVALALAIFFGCSFVVVGPHQIYAALKSGVIQLGDLGKVKKPDHPLLFWIGVAVWLS